MKQELVLLNEFDAEHNELLRDAQNLEHKANDLDAITGLKKASEGFVPWSMDLCKQILQDLQRSLEGGNLGKEFLVQEKYTAVAVGGAAGDGALEEAELLVCREVTGKFTR